MMPVFSLARFHHPAARVRSVRGTTRDPGSPKIRDRGLPVNSRRASPSQGQGAAAFSGAA